MCLLVLAWRSHPRYRLVVAANRDEFHARAAAPSRPGPTSPGVVGGRDLQAMGAWFAVDQRTPLRHRHQLPRVRPPPAQRAFARRIDSGLPGRRSGARRISSGHSRPTRRVMPASTCCSRIAIRSGTPRTAPTSSRASCRPASTDCPTNSSIRPGPSWCASGSVSTSLLATRSPPTAARWPPTCSRRWRTASRRRRTRCRTVTCPRNGHASCPRLSCSIRHMARAARRCSRFRYDDELADHASAASTRDGEPAGESEYALNADGTLIALRSARGTRAQVRDSH